MMFTNIIHRPSDIAYLNEFKIQQDMSHSYGLKTTMLVPFSTLFQPEIVEYVKLQNRDFGDEIGLYFGDFRCKEFDSLFTTDEIQFWLFSFEDKKKMTDLFMNEFHQQFGCYPTSIGCYLMEPKILKYIKNTYPSVECLVATCFEEGINMFRGVTNCWYLFSEGGPWWPWIPSQNHIQAPAKSKEKSIDVVAIPHLVRDMTISMFNRNDFFASHPANLLRGKVYKDEQLAYDLNFIDQYVVQADYNNGYSYYNMFVGPNWLAHSHFFEEDKQISVDLYEKSLKYLSELKEKGLVMDMTMTEFSVWFKANRSYSDIDKIYWQDILYNSSRENFWCINYNYRLSIDMAKGGAITDLRPYAGEMEASTGPDTKHLWNNSFPYLINSYRFHGYAYLDRGNIASVVVSYKGKNYNVCQKRLKADCITNNGNTLEIKPFNIEIEGEIITLKISYEFGVDQIHIESEILNGPDEKLELIHYISGTYATTDFPEDNRGIILKAVSQHESKELTVEYSSKLLEIQHPEYVKAIVPQVNTELCLIPLNGAERGSIKDECLSGPFYNLALYKKIKTGENLKTCLKIQKIQ